MAHSNSGTRWGFSIALVTPSIFSTLKQAEREMSAELHALAKLFLSSSQQPSVLNEADMASLRQLGAVLSQQLLNGTLFLCAARAAVLTFGLPGGVLAQVAITLNTMFNPRQRQRLNPARLLGSLTGLELNWTDCLSPAQQTQLAWSVGKTAARMGYGEKDDRVFAGNLRPV